MDAPFNALQALYQSFNNIPIYESESGFSDYEIPCLYRVPVKSIVDQNCRFGFHCPPGIVRMEVGNREGLMGPSIPKIRKVLIDGDEITNNHRYNVFMPISERLPMFDGSIEQFKSHPRQIDLEKHPLSHFIVLPFDMEVVFDAKPSYLTLFALVAGFKSDDSLY